MKLNHNKKSPETARSRGIFRSSHLILRQWCTGCGKYLIIHPLKTSAIKIQEIIDFFVITA